MPLQINPDHMIHTEGNGVLGDSSEVDVKALTEKAVQSEHIVIHLHGGLVDKKAGVKMAERLTPFYKNSETYPIFFVWESGVLESVFNNLREIIKEPVFKKLLTKILKWVWGKTLEASGVRTIGGLSFPNDLEVDKEVKSLLDGDGQLNWTTTIDELTELSDDESRAFQNELSRDAALQIELQAIAAQVLDDTDVTISRGVTIQELGSGGTRMSPVVIDELKSEIDENGRIGVIAFAKFAVRAGKILHRVIQRLNSGRDHGRYTTVIEEILQEFYVANIGGSVWKMMKEDTRQTFEQDGENRVRGGDLFLQELGKKIGDGQVPKVSIVGHSAGAIFACHLLQSAARASADPSHPLPQNFAFTNTIFLAPAAKFSLFKETLDKCKAMMGQFRMFTLREELEAGYWEVPGYKGSLLYMVSGLFEESDNDHDEPLIGMERYWMDDEVYQGEDYESIRAFIPYLSEDKVVWSVQTGKPAGLNADSRKHGAFDDTDPGSSYITMESVGHLLRGSAE